MHFIAGPVPIAVPQPDPHSVSGVLVHMPHVCSVCIFVFCMFLRIFVVIVVVVDLKI